MSNPFVHMELNTTDACKAKAFYGKLFDWKMEDVPMGPTTYTMLGVGQGTAGGLVQHPIQGGTSAWLPYVMVDDLAAANLERPAHARGNRIGRRDDAFRHGYFSPQVAPGPPESSMPTDFTCPGRGSSPPRCGHAHTRP